MINKILKYLNLINPLYYCGKRKTAQLEKEIWGDYEIDGIDFMTVQDVNTKNHSRYQITRPQHLEFVRGYLSSKKITSSDGIIDIGCGKGAMLFVFSEYGFGHIAGLEFYEELCQIAKNNLHKRNIVADVIHADAMTFDTYDIYNYFYMYNPFSGEILQNVIGYLNKSVNRNPRDIHIIYCNPRHGDLFIEAGYTIEKTFKTTLFFTEDAVVYCKKNQPIGEAIF